jgi:hypothetical protein
MYRFYAAMPEDGALTLLPQRVPDQPGGRADTLLWRMDAAGLRGERVPSAPRYSRTGGSLLFVTSWMHFPLSFTSKSACDVLKCQTHTGLTFQKKTMRTYTQLSIGAPGHK